MALSGERHPGRLVAFIRGVVKEICLDGVCYLWYIACIYLLVGPHSIINSRLLQNSIL